MDARQITRRWFFEQCGVGLGTAALGHLLAESGFADAAHALSAQGEARDLSLHGGRAQPSGTLRQQAATD